jgi:hypothetical protein
MVSFIMFDAWWQLVVACLQDSDRDIGNLTSKDEKQGAVVDALTSECAVGLVAIAGTFLVVGSGLYAGLSMATGGMLVTGSAGTVISSGTVIASAAAGGPNVVDNISS